MALQPAPKLSRTLVPRPKSKLKPPLFRFGWRLGLDEMERIVLAQFREAVIMVERPPDFSGRDNDGDLVDLPDSQDRTQCASILSTLLSASLMDAIAERIDLPREQRYLLKLGAMCSSEGVLDWGLEVGTNYTTVVPSKYRKELKKILGMTEEPMWYLDFRKWHWREVRTRKGECRDGSYWFSSLILPSSCA